MNIPVNIVKNKVGDGFFILVCILILTLMYFSYLFRNEGKHYLE